MVKNKEKIFLALFLLLIIGLSFLSLAIYQVSPATAHDEGLIKGIYLGPYPGDGLTYREVEDLLQGDREAILALSVLLKLNANGDQALEFTYEQLGIDLDLERIWLEAYQIGRTGSWWNRTVTRIQVRRKGLMIPLYQKINQQQALEVLQASTEHLHIPPQDASLQVKPGDKIEIQPAVPGRRPDLKELLLNLVAEVEQNQQQNITLALTYQVIEPKISTAEVRAYRITGLLSSYSTYYNAQNVKRSTNVQLAAKAIDGYLLKPGEIFSFNGVVGPRTKERGYQEANVIINNKMVPDVGGGVCQVSSTLYNAVLKAQLEVLQRHPHSLLISYVPPGLDAAVAYGSLDFSFRNNTEGHLLLKSSAYGGTLTFKIFGRVEDKGKIELKSIIEKELPCETTYVEDPSIPQGEYVLDKEGTNGIYVRAERHIYTETGELLRKEILSRDYYPPENRVIRTSSDSLITSPVNEGLIPNDY